MELLLVYVDDLFFMSPSPMSRDQFKVDLQTDFKLNENKSQSSHKFSAETPSILNIGMIRDWENDTLIVHHANFIEHMAKKFNLDKGPKTLLPMSSVTVFRKATADQVIKNSEFRNMVGSLMFLVCVCRPDLAFTVNTLSKYFENPSTEHINGAKRAILYAYSTRYLGIQFKRIGKENRVHINNVPVNELTAYCDASFQTDLDTFRSVNGGLIMFNGSPITWWSKISRLISTSTAESELVAAGEALKTIAHLRLMCQEVQHKQIYPTELFEDNTATISFAEPHHSIRKVKHYLSRVAFVQEQHEIGNFNFTYINTKEQLADGLTKPLPITAFHQFIKMINMVDASIAK